MSDQAAFIRAIKAAAAGVIRGPADRVRHNFGYPLSISPAGSHFPPPHPPRRARR